MINPFGKTYTDNELVVFEYLKRLHLFADLSNKEMSVFIPYLHERTYQRDEVIFFRNDPSHALYLLRRGRVSFTLDVNDNFEELTEFSGEEVIGINCIIPNSKRLVNAIVLSDRAEFYVIPQDNLFSIFENNEDIKMKMYQSLAGTMEQRMGRLFKSYKSSFGMFNLSDIYKD